jgi:hypothetical protein
MSTVPTLNQPASQPVTTGRWRLTDAATIRAAAGRAAAREAWRKALPLIVCAALRTIPGPTRILAWAWATGYALMGRRQAIMALAMIWFCPMFTHVLGYPPGGAAIFRHGAIFAAAFSVFVLHAGPPPRSRTPLLLWWTAGMSLLLIAHSIVFSTMADISVLKAISFAVVMQTLLTGWSRLSAPERTVTESQLWGLFYGIAIFSVPLVVLPAGYLRTGTGFQGVMEHPQLFGQICAIVAVWLSATWLTDPKMRISLKLLVPILLTGLYLSRTRGGLLMFVVGMSFALMTGPISAALARARNAPRLLKRRLAAALLGAAVLAALFGSTLSEGFQQFIRKTGKADTALEAAIAARGFMIDRMWVNIQEKPWAGIGLGVPSHPELLYALVRDPIFGLPIMATVEKGVLPVAMVEEMGWPLALLYAPWFVALLWNAMRAGPRYIGVCAAALTLGVSEAAFFSPGGGGLIIQLLVAMAATAAPLGSDCRSSSR